MKIAIIGGGIGGLCAAICMRLRGHEVHVYERADAFREVGAGLQISPNGMKVLDSMGVRLPDAFRPEALDMFEAETGRQIFHLPLDPLRRRWGGEYVHIHRAHLLDQLLRRAEELGAKLHLNAELDFIDDGAVHFVDGSAAQSDLIIGADGVHSRVANHVAPEHEAEFSGYVAWRALVPVQRLKTPPPPTASVWKKAGSHIVTTRIHGGEMVNFVGISEAKWSGDHGSFQTTHEQVRGVFGVLDPILSDIIEHAENFTAWPLLRRATPKNWYKDNAVLLGDAAHPMLPSMAQGAVMAIEDTWVLAQVLSDDISESFARYQKIRARRIAHVVGRSYANAKWFHRRGTLKTCEDFVFKAASRIYPEVIYRQLDRVYKYDVRDEV